LVEATLKTEERIQNREWKHLNASSLTSNMVFVLLSNLPTTMVFWSTVAAANIFRRLTLQRHIALFDNTMHPFAPVR
jgi:polyferredoxin